MNGSIIRDRIKNFCRVPARDLFDHDGNPRRHPQAQRDALRGVLEQVGIAAALVAYRSERNGGKLTLVDGHLRKHPLPSPPPPRVQWGMTGSRFPASI
jgi:hypothetical protein